LKLATSRRASLSHGLRRRDERAREFGVQNSPPKELESEFFSQISVLRAASPEPAKNGRSKSQSCLFGLCRRDRHPLHLNFRDDFVIDSVPRFL
jgi:hypothetical protein